MPKRKRNNVKSKVFQGKFEPSSLQNNIQESGRKEASVASVGRPGSNRKCEQPLLSPSSEFLKILQRAGAEEEVFTEREILYYLRQYISSRQLYDLDDPSVVHCGKDDLGRALKVDRFTINDVLYLIASNTVQVNRAPPSLHTLQTPTTQQVLRKRNYLSQQTHQTISKKQDNLRVPSLSQLCSITLTDKDEVRPKRIRKSSLVIESDKTSVTLYSGSDVEHSVYVLYASEDSDILSIQGYETAVVQDSADDLYWIEETDSSEVGFEYEINSESDDNTGFITTTEDLLVSCCDSDVEFWADSSDTSDTESLSSDIEISDEDKWRCLHCDKLNTPLQGYCDRCWAVRPSWLPDKRAETRRDPRFKPVRKSASVSAGKMSDRGMDSDEMNTHGTSAPPLYGHRGSSSATTKSDDIDRSTPYTAAACTNDMTSTKDAPSNAPHNDNEAIIEVTPHAVQSTDMAYAVYGFVGTESLAVNPGYAVDESDNSKECIQTLPDDNAECTMQMTDSSHNIIGSIPSEEPSASTSIDPSHSLVYATMTNQYNNNNIHTAPDIVAPNNTVPGSNNQCTVETMGNQPSCVPDNNDSTPQDIPVEPGTSTVPDQPKNYNDMCIVCFTRPKDASLVHGKTGHQVCCYQCAKRLWRRGKSCPVCRRPIKFVIRNYCM